MSDCKYTKLVFEDTVQCLFFFNITKFDDNFWERRNEDINQIITKLTDGYIWHRDDFRVCLPITIDKGIPKHLMGITCFGDNIEDEWFIVYLILKITETFRDMIVQVTDSDGDFLLIEAADHLPSWANPQSTENRVFIHNGSIHIIPPTLKENIDLKIDEAISLISENPEVTVASQEVQQAIIDRIGTYPEKISQNLHQAIVNLPLKIASLLQMKPALISQLVTTYCNHDSIDAKLCRDLSFEDIHPVEVKFTKCLYAMLVTSKLLNFRKIIFPNTQDKRTNIGIKLTCAYNIITRQHSDDMFSSKQFNTFIDSLSRNGYFKDNIKGSRDYNILLNNAKNYFMSIECPNSTTVYNDIQKLMLLQDLEKYKASLRPVEDLKEDNDDWLNIDPQNLNNILNKRYGQKIEKIEPETMSSQLVEFLQQTSNFEGIEANEFGSTMDDPIEFDTDEFMASLQKMLKIVSNGKTENEDSDEDLDAVDDIDDLNMEIEGEIKDKLKDKEDLDNSKSILHNIVQSLKEEQGNTGPSSNILRSIGIHKNDILDSDDDE